MKKTLILVIVLFPLLVFSQNSIEWSDDFSDGDFTNNPTWSGITDNFIVNAEKQLQLNAPKEVSRSYLSTRSEVFDDATWEFWVKINNTTSANNYSMVYIISDRLDISGDVNGYYVQIGNTADEISLYKQRGSKRVKIIDGVDKSIDTKPVIVSIRVTRTKDGEFSLFRKRESTNSAFNDADWIQEGVSVVDNDIQGSKYFGVLAQSTKSNNKNYIFDNISVRGDRLLDVTPPVWLDLRLVESNQMVLTFSEEVDLSDADFIVDNGIGAPSSVQLSAGNTVVTLTFSQNFENGVIYTVQANNVKDLAGNPLENTEQKIGILEDVMPGDLVINEIMFDPFPDVPEYFEVCNNSSKVLDLSRVFFTTRKKDHSFNTPCYFPQNTILLPQQHLAIAKDPDTLRIVYEVPDTANIAFVEKFHSLPNDGGSLLLVYEPDSTILDEVTYSPKWHHTLIRSSKGVSLERINPEMDSQNPDTWHSASTDVNYGTPGYRNSQFREMAPTTSPDDEKWFYPDPEAFTPDNDGQEDVCFIRYKTEAVGYTANIMIFNAVGVKVTQLTSNQILGAEGFLIWDGKTDRGINVNPGIYVLYVELINADSGVKKIEKMPIVVSAR
ncbi:MAG: hypothetical protein GX361_05370 [Bacteroidales bacterium]|nr:hypothetical protein [Bacteroidales bacterium]